MEATNTVRYRPARIHSTRRLREFNDDFRHRRPAAGRLRAPTHAVSRYETCPRHTSPYPANRGSTAEGHRSSANPPAKPTMAKPLNAGASAGLPSSGAAQPGKVALPSFIDRAIPSFGTQKPPKSPKVGRIDTTDMSSKAPSAPSRYLSGNGQPQPVQTFVPHGGGRAVAVAGAAAPGPLFSGTERRRRRPLSLGAAAGAAGARSGSLPRGVPRAARTHPQRARLGPPPPARTASAARARKRPTPPGASRALGTARR